MRRLHCSACERKSAFVAGFPSSSARSQRCFVVPLVSRGCRSSLRKRLGTQRALLVGVNSEPAITKAQRQRLERIASWSAVPDATCNFEALTESLRTVYADTSSLPPCLPQTVEFSILQAQYATLHVLRKVPDWGVWSIELPMGRTKDKWYHAVPANELRRYSRDLFHDYVEVFTQQRGARVCVCVAPLDATARQLGGGALMPLRRWRGTQARHGVAADSPGTRDADSLRGSAPKLLTYYEDIDPNEEIARCLMRAVFDSARNVLEASHTADDASFLDVIGIADAAADPERNLLGLTALDTHPEAAVAAGSTSPWMLVPRDRRCRLRTLFAVRNALLADAGCTHVAQAFDGDYGDDLLAALPDVVVITNAVASRHLGSVLRIVDACRAVGVPVVLFNCFLDLARLTDVRRMRLATHEEAALEASAHVQLARQQLGEPKLPLPEVLRRIRDGSVLGAEACYVCRCLPHVGALWRMRGAHEVGLGAFHGSTALGETRPAASLSGSLDADPWHLFAEVDWLEYEYATSVSYTLRPTLMASELEDILLHDCGYSRRQPERLLWSPTNSDSEPLWSRRGSVHHAGYWPSMVPAMDFDQWAPPLDAGIDTWMWR
jgi:hypothetical protein